MWLLLIWFPALLAAGENARASIAPASLETQRVSQQREMEFEGLVQLLGVRRIFVDKLTGGATADQMRDLLMAHLRETRLFLITENRERADATLRGAAEDLVYTEQHQMEDGINANVSGGIGRGSKSRTGGVYGQSSVGSRESLRVTERRHEAMASLRLVNKDGDVIWSTTQESNGAKFRGASADVADKVARKLAEDYERARRLR
ncbi:MAG: hypothetical protein ACKV22_13450 [Bryobacteraceae bacterium]